MNIKKGDNVIILAGKDKGKKGTVVRAMPKDGKVVIDGINMTKRHKRPARKGEKGSVINMAMPIHASNVKKAD